MPQGMTRPALAFFNMTLISRVFGYARDAVIMIFFGAGGTTDAFLVAFRLPNFLRRLFAEGAFSQAFVPLLAAYRRRDPAQVQPFIDRTAGSLAAVLLGLSLLGAVAAPLLILVLAPGFSHDASQRALASGMLRITFPYIFFISLTALIAGVLNVYGRFAVPAFTPVLLNLSLIIATVWVAPVMHEPITALAWGVLVAGCAQLLLQWLALRRTGLRLRLVWGFYDTRVRRVLRLMSPAMLGASIVQVNLLIDTVIASFLVAGSISWLYISDRFVELPVGLFGVAVATVLLVRLSAHFAAARRAAFGAALNWAASVGWLLALPCAVGLMLLAEPVLVALVQYQAFSVEDTAMARLSLIAYATGLPAFILVKTLNAGFFARLDTRLPVRTAHGGAGCESCDESAVRLAVAALWSARCARRAGVGNESRCVDKLRVAVSCLANRWLRDQAAAGTAGKNRAGVSGDGRRSAGAADRSADSECHRSAAPVGARCARGEWFCRLRADIVAAWNTLAPADGHGQAGRWYSVSRQSRTLP